MMNSSLRRQKIETRHEVSQRVGLLDPSARLAEEIRLRKTFVGLPGLGQAQTILFYLSAFADEIDTFPLVSHWLERQRATAIVVPRVDRKGRRLVLHRLRSLNELIVSPLGIKEPKPTAPEVDPGAVDWALIPGIAFDRRCRRLGRGAGHYDRLLPQFRCDATKVAMILEAQWVEEVPDEPHDVPVDLVVSATEIAVRPGFQPPSTVTFGGSA